MNLFDAVHLQRLSDTAFNNVVHPESADTRAMFERIYGEGRGVVALTGHTGCFEMLLPLVAQRWKCPAFAVGQQLFDPRIDRLVAQARSGANMDYIRRTDNPRAIIRLLREGRTFGALIDQDTNVEGVFARFLGRPAYTPCGPVKLAMKYRIPVVVFTTARQPDNTHRVFVSDRLGLEDSGNMGRDLVVNVEKANELLCTTIERFPPQWVWMHRRWRKKPDDARYRHVPGAQGYL
jgi:KDO2-lipid IV(A) lauroyltransferase